MTGWRPQTILLLVMVTAVFVFLLPINQVTQCRNSEDPVQRQFPQGTFNDILGKKDIIVYGKQELNDTLQQYQQYKQGLLTPAMSKAVAFRKDNWLVDCITWEKRLEINFEEIRVHDFLMDVYHLGPGEDHDKRHALFQEIYNKKDWPATDLSYHGLQSSGPGAMLKHTQGIIAALHVIITKIKQFLGKSTITVLDVPCGDLQWMSQFLVTRNDILYTGMDIVPEIIEHHKTEFSRLPRTRFIQQDIVKTPLNESYDLILCRDLLQHLWQVDAIKALDHISASKSNFLLATSYPDNDRNREVEKDGLGGRKSGYNLEVEPFFLIPPICMSYDWNVEHVGLWELPLKQRFDSLK